MPKLGEFAPEVHRTGAMDASIQTLVYLVVYETGIYGSHVEMPLCVFPTLGLATDYAMALNKWAAEQGIAWDNCERTEKECELLANAHPDRFPHVWFLGGPAAPVASTGCRWGIQMVPAYATVPAIT